MVYDKKELNKYPDIMSKEDMRKACHISKRTAQFLLQFNLIPHICTGKKTRCYKINKSDVIAFMIDHNLMDLENKPGKASTGYMTSLKKYKAPFVFSCFNHTIFDMQVLSHELGHAFAGYCAMRHQPISDYFHESTDIAEIHSMSMEQFCYPYAEYMFGDMADKYRFAHLQEALTFVPFGVAVDEFQHIIYENPDLTPKERTYEWHKLEEKYMPWRTYSDDEFMDRGGYWYHKLHIFLYPFYYINYTLTTMGAMEFKKKQK